MSKQTFDPTSLKGAPKIKGTPAIILTEAPQLKREYRRIDYIRDLAHVNKELEDKDSFIDRLRKPLNEIKDQEENKGFGK